MHQQRMVMAFAPDDIEARITVLFMQFEVHRNMIGKAMGFGE
jgi:hypothetical protein